MKELEEERKAATDKAYMEWSKAKALSEQAVRYLDACELPTNAFVAEQGPEATVNHWLVSIRTHCQELQLSIFFAYIQLRMCSFNCLLQAVGRALKAVDVTLFKNWVDWSKGKSGTLELVICCNYALP